jgi:hypothetical protein
VTITPRLNAEPAETAEKTTRSAAAWFAILAATLLAACSRGLSPVEPAPLVDVTGSWSGTASDSSGHGEMTWELVQAEASISGAFSMRDAETGYGARGSASGTVSGTRVRFKLKVPIGGADGPWAACTIEVEGDIEATTASLSGNYSGSNSCGGAITAGQLTLHKQ